jgi:hypothetical protein
VTQPVNDRQRPSSARRWRIGLAAIVLSAALAGCGAAAPDLESDTARQLQAKVLTVSQAAAGTDPAGALRSLDELVAQLDASAAEGDVSFKRHQSIMTAIDAVRADLGAAQAAAAATQAAATPAPSGAAAPPAVKAPAPALSPPPPPAPSPSPTSEETGPGKGERGKGKG